VTQNALLFCI